VPKQQKRSDLLGRERLQGCWKVVVVVAGGVVAAGDFEVKLHDQLEEDSKMPFLKSYFLGDLLAKLRKYFKNLFWKILGETLLFLSAIKDQLIKLLS
jgi:hypothetical protein